MTGAKNKDLARIRKCIREGWPVFNSRPGKISRYNEDHKEFVKDLVVSTSGIRKSAEEIKEIFLD